MPGCFERTAHMRGAAREGENRGSLRRYCSESWQPALLERSMALIDGGSPSGIEFSTGLVEEFRFRRRVASPLHRGDRVDWEIGGCPDDPHIFHHLQQRLAPEDVKVMLLSWIDRLIV